VAIVLVAVLLAAPGAASAPRRSLLHGGDSLGVGTQWYLHGALAGWHIRSSLAISRHANEGPGVLRRYGSGLPRVILVSLGTNDDPRQLGVFRRAVRATMRIAGRRRCVVWVNIVRPPVAGASYRGMNVVLGREARRRRNLRVFNWARVARRHRYWFGGDGVHPSAAGYRARARGVARAVRRCH
jgi:lysophospholipase L1-like esterase